MEVWDVVVVGNSIAGLRAAIAAHDNGANVVQLSYESLDGGEGETDTAGIAVSLDETTSINHRDDTIRSGYWLCDQEIVSIRTAAVQHEIVLLEQWGVNFRRNQSESPLLETGPGHTAPRLANTGDSTTREVREVLEEQCIKRNITQRKDWVPMAIAHGTATINGIVALDMQEGEIVPIISKALIIADGGFEAAWNGYGSSGRGLSLALEAGCSFRDMEFIAWDPLHVAETELTIPLGLLANGAFLTSQNGVEMEFENTKTPTDISFKIKQEGNNALLDARKLSVQATPWFSGITNTIEQRTGLDLASQPIPISPHVGRTIGGLGVDRQGRVIHENLNSWFTGLYAVGGAACSGVHGASSAAGNLMLEDLLGAASCGTHAGNWSKERSTSGVESVNHFANASMDYFTTLLESVGSNDFNGIGSLPTRLESIMSTSMGFARDSTSLDECSGALNALLMEAESVGLQDGSTVMNTEFTNLTSLIGLIKLSRISVAAASARMESRGSHQRVDYPNRDDDKMLKHTFINNGLERCWLPLRKSSSGNWIIPPGE